MKTSNKILLLFFGFILFIILCGITYVRFFGMSSSEEVIGNNNVISTTRDITGFHQLKVSGNMEVHIAEGDFNVTILGESNLHEYIDVELEGEQLTIKNKRGFRLKPNTPIQIEVTSPKWDEIVSAGSNNLQSKDTLHGDKLSLEMAGAGQTDLLTAYDHYVIEMAGAPVLSMAGNGSRLELDLAGAAQFKGKHLLTKSARVEAAGASSIWVHADSLLDVQLVGASNITYSGNPPTINSNLSGACTINKED